MVPVSRTSTPEPPVEPAADEEEGLHRYHIGGFHPVMGDTRRYGWSEIKSKSIHSTFTPQDLNSDRAARDKKLWAMKVLSAECYGAGTDIFELEILQHLKKVDIKHAGYQYISTLADSFTHEGPNGSHVCLIFKVMGESFSTFRHWFQNGKVLSQVAAKFATQILQALDYAHTCGVIHTGKSLNSIIKCSVVSIMLLDIQPGNIMIQVPDESLINGYLESTLSETSVIQEATQGTSQDVSPEASEYTIIPTQSLRDYYFPDEGFNIMTLDIALSDWGVASWTNNHLTDLIQPVLLRSPEVMLEAPWGPSTDIWNLGALVPEFIYNQSMFSGKTEAGEYSFARHLEEMTKLLGPFPSGLLEKGNQKLVKDTFDSEGNILEPKMKSFVGLDVRYSDMEDVEREEFTAFTKVLMCLDPEKRKSAKELLDEAWLNHPWGGKMEG
ncbi:Serine/threonine-protein kinase SRPK [Lachnellula suecica]|uniref:non-specific serine/threonine protein kinase n=1 Tax=Lachnellula suecica TaxID=602035 RepID=A0A8T9BQR8_9HELO|nr:Serine/threonine-protein kinase SRPK [Lachnellula suecica]